MKDLFQDKGATFSDCRNYRYALWRIWDTSKPLIMWIGLNPSTANEEKNDPTIRRVIRFSRDWGYGGVYMMNLFAYVTPYPSELETCQDPIRENDLWLDSVSKKCEKIVFCWGSFEQAQDRALEVGSRFEGVALQINSDGSPRHPLYVKSDIKPIDYFVTGSENDPFKSRYNAMV